MGHLVWREAPAVPADGPRLGRHDQLHAARRNERCGRSISTQEAPHAPGDAHRPRLGRCLQHWLPGGWDPDGELRRRPCHLGCCGGCRRQLRHDAHLLSRGHAAEPVAVPRPDCIRRDAPSDEEVRCGVHGVLAVLHGPVRHPQHLCRLRELQVWAGPDSSRRHSGTLRRHVDDSSDLLPSAARPAVRQERRDCAGAASLWDWKRHLRSHG
mmetsp:Transcript_856/g.3570  ORF Transcript_856/g.3570 Transcript_856/m.3570 type:complete len:211 (-) Transcript_856:549-1181(-)